MRNAPCSPFSALRPRPPHPRFPPGFFKIRHSCTSKATFCVARYGGEEFAVVLPEAGAKISLDLASYTVVEAALPFLRSIIAKYVDIVIANEDEAFAFTGYRDEEEALVALSKETEIAVVKKGSRGSIIGHAGKVYHIDPIANSRIVDTTGAGDLWAAGFLYGLLQGYSLEKCGMLGSACGFEACRVVGATIPDEGWNRIKMLL